MDNIKKLNKIIALDPFLLNDLFSNQEEYFDKNQQINLQDKSSFIELENASNKDKNININNSLDIADIDFDAI